MNSAAPWCVSNRYLQVQDRGQGMCRVKIARPSEEPCKELKIELSAQNNSFEILLSDL